MPERFIQPNKEGSPQELFAFRAASHLIHSIREQLPEENREKSPYWRMSHEKIMNILRAQGQLTIDQRLGIKTPDWIKEIAKEDIYAVLNNEPERFLANDEDIVYADILTTSNKACGRKTPDWIKKLAEKKKTRH